ncbi:hypothetical protein CE91St41_06490 [Oscillospiraceae bacterium]|nr:hypothetical protein CE91St40_06490 [Oscillospiraceae bacterium]BDF73760.1 hypothetical protein CE91St41_06490 [Oscillospiraceae bacterium]
MRLGAMRYKDYVWPHNPRVYTIDYERGMAVQKIPFGRYRLQDLGPTRRVMRGEGEFVGPTAYEEFKKLASVFYGEGPGMLVHPVWQSASAYFAELSLRQEPRADYVRYAFAFWEDFAAQESALRPVEPAQGEQDAGAAGRGAQYHTVARGETLWGIAAEYGISLTGLIALNPQIKNPNLILVGEKVRVK